MGVFLLVLKIIGIIVLGIIGLIALVLLCLLIIPFRYKSNVYTNNNRIESYIKLSWFLKIISIKVVTLNLSTDISFKVFGFNINKKNKKIKIKENNKENIEQTFDNSDETYDNYIEEKNENKKQNKKRNIFERIIEILKNIPRNIKHSADNLEYKIRRICDIISTRRELFKSKRFKKAYTRLKKNCKIIFRAVKPKRFKCNVIVGFEDKMYTGLLVAFFSMLYPYFENSLKVKTVDESIIKVDLKAKGRFRIYRLIKPIRNIYKDKEIKALINEIKI